MLSGGFFLIIDQTLKYYARSYPQFSYYLIEPWLGWEFYQNPGIAFGISFPTKLLIIITPIILILFIFLFLNSKEKINYFAIFGLLTTGAISNFIDRVLFGVTIDYLRIYTSLLNLADILIVISLIILIFNQLKK